MLIVNRFTEAIEPMGIRDAKESNAPRPELPLVSIVVPVRNESAYIERCLNAVLALDYPANRLEIIVSDGMSIDQTRELVKEFQARYSTIRLIDNPGRIAPTGLNAAIAQAKGEVIVRVDGHCEIAPSYVRRCVHHLVLAGVQGVGGPLETIGETTAAAAIAAAMSTRFGVGDSAFRTAGDKTMLTDTVAFPAYTRAILNQAGPFDEELVRNQDDEYNYRLRGLGAKILMAADVRARYYSRSSFRSLWRQYFQYGYWKVRVLQKHPYQMRPRQFVPPLFVAVIGICLAFAPFTVAGLYALAAVAGCYLIGNVGASCLTARKKGWRLLPLLPLAFVTLHVSYGLGFLIGLCRFWKRWRMTSLSTH